MAPAPLLRHQVLVGALYSRLARWADAHPPAFVGLSPLDVRLGPDRIVQPDLFVMLGGRPPLDQLLVGVPEFVVEILSSKPSYDRMTKRLLYAEAGVAEYWLVDPLDRTVEVVHGIQTVATRTDRVESTVCAGLTLDLSSLFTVLD